MICVAFILELLIKIANCRLSDNEQSMRIYGHTFEQGNFAFQNDNVATLLADVEKGQQIEIIDDGNRAQGIVTCKQAITFGNKVAVSAISTRKQSRKRVTTLALPSKRFRSASWYMYKMSAVPG